MRQCIVWALVATLATTTTATARAQEPDAAPDVVTRAKQHYEAGRALYELGKYDQALVEFDEGFRLAPRPNFLVNMAQCHRRLGRTAAARALYEKFLAAAPDDDPMRPEVRRILSTLDTEPLAPATGPLAVTTPPRRRPWYRDPVAGVLLAGGLAAVVVGVVLVSVASARISHAADSYDDFLAARGADDERTAGAVVLAGGAALVAGAAIRYAVVRF